MAGASVQWLRDKMRLFKDSAESGALAKASDPASEVYLVPAFVGLGAPWWDADARGAIYGLTRNTSAGDLARAALESVAYQTQDLLSAMRKDWKGARDTVLRVDGGMVASDWTMQFLSDILDVPVDRPTILETTALGAAWLAGWKAGVWPDMKGFSKRWSLERQFNPSMNPALRRRKLRGWHDAIARTLTR
jgi:glycerol kinase